MPVATYQPDPFRELAQIEAWKNRRQRVEEEAEGWTPGMAYRLARMQQRVPWLEPGIKFALVQAGYGPNDPLVDYAARESALQRSEQLGGWQPAGSVIRPGMSAREIGDAVRLKHEILAGRALGLFDDDGLLHEPPERNEDDPFYAQFLRIEDAFKRAERELPYVDYRGRPAVVRYRENSAAQGLDPWDIEYLGEERDLEGGGRLPGVGAGVGSEIAGALGLGEVQQAGLVPGDEAAWDVVKGLSRGVFMGFDFPVQELQGQFRNLVGALNDKGVDWFESQSDLGIVLRTGTDDAGQGFFVGDDSPVAVERRRRERERGQIGGQNITIGRWVASQVVEPGTKPYRLLSGLVDAGVQVADPSAYALGKASGVAKAGRVFRGAEAAEGVSELRNVGRLARGLLPFGSAEAAVEAAGGIRGIRRIVHGPTADAWLNGPIGTRVVEGLAADPSPSSIWRTLGRKVEPRIAAQLADASDPGEVADILRPLLGTTFRRTTDVGPTRLRQAVEGLTTPTGAVLQKTVTPGARRMTSRMPGHRIDTFDPNSAMAEVEAWLSNAKVAGPTATSILDRFARQETRAGMFDVVKEAMTETDGVLARHGITSAPLRSKLTRLFSDTHEDARHWFVDEIGADVPVWSNIMVDGEGVNGFSPHLGVELLDRYIPLPDARAVRRMTSKFRRVLAKGETGDLRLPWAAAMWLQDELWKPVTLLRAAWPIRVVGEEQLRMAASGLESMFRHPASFIAWATGRKGGTDLAGDALSEAEEFQRAMMRGTGGWLREPNRVRTAGTTLYRNTVHERDDFLQGWAGELAMLYNDPVASHVARSATLDEATDWFFGGAGQKFRRELMEAGHPELAQRPVARNYLESISARIAAKTGGHADLLEVVRRGKLNGDNILQADGIRHADLAKRLEAYLDSAPEAVKGPISVTIGATTGDVALNGWRRFTDSAFGWLMTRETNWLSRSPAFRQQYWQRVEELAEHADADSLAQLADAAREAGMGSRYARRLRGRSAVGDLNLDEIDMLAKGFALDETKRLLYDLSERSQFFDAMRLVFPFGEAWKEVITRWSKLALTNPKVVRRAQQVIEGARGEDFGEVVGSPDGQGFFFENEFGEEVFVYPGSEWLTRQTVGVPIPLTGRVEGLSLMTDVIPGLGPVAMMPASIFLPDKPATRELRELILPFGTPGDDGEQGGWTQLLNYAPAWFRRGWQFISSGGFDDQSDRIWNNTVMDVARYLSSTGRYDTSTPAGQQELLEDARSKARRFYAVRSLAQFVAPSAPSPEWLVEANGELVRTAVLAEEYQRLVSEDPESAAETFLGLYGEDLALVAQPKTRTITPGLEATTEARDWMEANPDIVRDFPNTWAFFAPRGGEFDYEVYLSQLRAGQREALTPEQWLRLSNDSLGNVIYAKARRMVGPSPTDDQSAWLRGVYDAIVERYPGFGDPSGLAERAPTERLIRELQKAADTAVLARTETGRGLNLYLEARGMAINQAVELGFVDHTRARDLVGTRDWLREVAARIIVKYPGFHHLWSRVYEREMADDVGVVR